jgi:hypothetical protein
MDVRALIIIIKKKTGLEIKDRQRHTLDPSNMPFSII